MQQPSRPSKHTLDVFQCLARTNGGRKYVPDTSLDSLVLSTGSAYHRDDALKEYIDAARWIPLSIHPFYPVANILYAGIAQDDEYEGYVYFVYLCVY
jgi:hypothetical protein